MPGAPSVLSYLALLSAPKLYVPCANELETLTYVRDANQNRRYIKVAAVASRMALCDGGEHDWDTGCEEVFLHVATQV